MKSTLVAAFILILSCSKEKDSNTKLDLLISQPWKWAKIEYRSNNDPWEDEVQYWPACQKDDEVIFYSNGSFDLTEGASRCNPSDPQLQDQLRWSFRDNESKILLDGVIWNIDALDESIFIAIYSEVVGTDTYFSRYTMQH